MDTSTPGGRSGFSRELRFGPFFWNPNDADKIYYSLHPQIEPRFPAKPNVRQVTFDQSGCAHHNRWADFAGGLPNRAGSPEQGMCY